MSFYLKFEFDRAWQIVPSITYSGVLIYRASQAEKPVWSIEVRIVAAMETDLINSRPIQNYMKNCLQERENCCRVHELLCHGGLKCGKSIPDSLKAAILY